MLINYITYNPTELNSGSGICKTITQRELTKVTIANTKKYYRPTGIKIKNNSGGQVRYGLFTDLEYNYYANSGTLISDLIPITDTDVEEINVFIGEITNIYAQGTSGHISNFEVIILQD